MRIILVLEQYEYSTSFNATAISYSKMIKSEVRLVILPNLLKISFIALLKLKIEYPFSIFLLIKG